MEHFPLCEFSGATKRNHERGDTISLVLFSPKECRGLKRYLSGLALWLKRHINKFPKSTTISLFVDENLRNHKVVKKALTHRRLQAFQFRCKDFMLDNYHVDLFPTLIRFFPAMAPDGSASTKCRIHVFDIEPASRDIDEHLELLKYVENYNANARHRIDFFYNSSNNLKTRAFASSDCPYVLAGRLTLFRRFESGLMTRFLRDMKASDRIEWYYGVMPTPFSRGVDEIFTNSYLLPYAIRKGFTIAYSEDYCITAPLYWWKSTILKEKSSRKYLQYILDKEGNDVEKMLEEFDRHFYGCQNRNGKSSDVAKRYYQILGTLIESSAQWFPLAVMKFVMENYDGYLSLRRLVVLTGNKRTFIDIDVHKIKD